VLNQASDRPAKTASAVGFRGCRDSHRAERKQA
jgi:hypothetical protein